MIAVIFEVTPKVEGKVLYFEMAQTLKSALSRIDGFISVERFQSLSNPDRFLSLSFWENETSVMRWKEYFEHKAAQKKGQEELFNHFRIRVGNVIRDYGSESQVTKH